MDANTHNAGYWRQLRNRMRIHAGLYLMLLPSVICLVVFWLLPLYGIQIAFREFDVKKGFFGSNWVGLKHFIRFFKSYNFFRTIRNTLAINVYGLVTGFPLTICLAVMFQTSRAKKLSSVAQIISYAPAFLSTVVVAGMIVTFFSQNYGLVNSIIVALGGDAKDFMGDPGAFWHIYTWSGIWQNIGFSTIMYMGAMSTISNELYEAATMDGAGLWSKIWHITLPGIKFIIAINLLLSLGNMLSMGFEKIFLLQNDMNLESSEVIATYVYKAGLIGGQFSYTTAIGLFNTAVNMLFLWNANRLCRKYFEYSIW